MWDGILRIICDYHYYLKIYLFNYKENCVQKKIQFCKVRKFCLATPYKPLRVSHSILSAMKVLMTLPFCLDF